MTGHSYVGRSPLPELHRQLLTCDEPPITEGLKVTSENTNPGRIKQGTDGGIKMNRFSQGQPIGTGTREGEHAVGAPRDCDVCKCDTHGQSLQNPMFKRKRRRWDRDLGLIGKGEGIWKRGVRGRFHVRFRV